MNFSDVLGPSIFFGLVAILLGSYIIKWIRPDWGKIRRTPEEVAQTLEHLVDGKEGDWEWDDFISIPIIDPRLDRYREMLLKLDKQFPHMTSCSEPEPAAIVRTWIAELRAMPAASGT